MTVSQKVIDLRRENDQLKAQVEFLQEVINKMPGWIQINEVDNSLDPVGMVNIFSNEASLKALGYSKDELMELGPRFLSEVLHEDDLKVVVDDMKNSKNLIDSEVVVHTFRTRLKNGDYIWTLVKSKVFRRNPDGTPSHFLNWIVDLSSDMQANPQIGDLIKEVHRSQNKVLLVNISRRESEVLALIAEGLSAKKISEKLNISILTVDTHRKNLLRKLRLPNIAALATFSAAMGI